VTSDEGSKAPSHQHIGKSENRDFEILLNHSHDGPLRLMVSRRWLDSSQRRSRQRSNDTLLWACCEIPRGLLESYLPLINIKDRIVEKEVALLNTTHQYRKYNTFKKWFHVIKNETTGLVIYRHVYKEVRAMIDSNPALQIPSSFYDWMHQGYTQVMVMGVSRLIDRRHDSVSFVRLMEEVEQFPEVLSRRRFVGLYPRHMRFMGDRDFNQFAPHNGQHVKASIIRRDRRRLIRAGLQIRKFRHKHIAHRADRSLRRLPTFQELNHCVDLLEQLLKKYTLLIEAIAMMDVLPTWQYDWKKVFRIHWIP
jgi:hypothetical protein